MSLADQVARDRIRDDLGSTLVVEAAAGTGKTTALVGRILSLVLTGTTTLARIVAVTFTEKAAGEMKIRLRTRLEELRSTSSEASMPYLERALRELEAARIGTIHGLCKDLLAERPVEAGIDPTVEVLSEAESRRLFDEAFDRWIEGALAEPSEGLRRLLRRPSRGGSSARDALRGAAWRLVEARDFRGVWKRRPFDRVGRIDSVVTELRELAELGRGVDADDNLTRHLHALQRWLEERDHREAVRPRDHDELEALLRSLCWWRGWNHKGYGEPFARGIDRAEVLARRTRVKEGLDRLVQDCDADLAPCLQQELWPLVDAYEALKVRVGRLDFLDLLLRTRQLLEGSASVRRELQERFSHLLVDEFQDTDPLQVDILMLLAAQESSEEGAAEVVPGKLFVVGDPKQSIYRFRRADIGIYETVKQRLLAGGASLLHLTVSFRSDPRLQETINAAFAPCMAGGSQASYVPLEAYRQAPEHQPAVVALPVPAPYGDYGTLWKGAIEASLPRAVAGWIDWLIGCSGWTVPDPRTGVERELRFSDVCLLFKRFRTYEGQATTAYVRELEVQGLPHVLVGGRMLHGREEVLALRTALAAVEWPDDELTVFAALKGPLFAVPDDALLAWRASVGRLHPLRPVDAGEQSRLVGEVCGALEVLRELHRHRNQRPIADTVGRLLEATRAHAGFANWNAGDQVLANVLRLADLARQFEAEGATSFRAFLQRLEREAARGGSSQAPVVEEGTEGIRIMTVHAAKGLEFPVVVLCEPTCPTVGSKPTRHLVPELGAWFTPLAGCVPHELLEASDEALRRDAEESHRLLYVAATRARDVLVVPAVGDEPVEGWVDPLHPTLYPPLGRRRKPDWSPDDFCNDSVVVRPPRVYSSPRTVCPGLHTSAAGTAVAWWDSSVLPASSRPAHGLRRHWLLVDDGEVGVSSRGIERHDRWQAAREQLLEAGTVPSVRVKTPRELAAEAIEQGGESVCSLASTTIERTDVDRSGRPGGARLGALIHAVLAELPLDAGPEAIRVGVAFYARSLGSPELELVAAEAAVEAALRHPLLRRAAASPELRREEPLTLARADGQLVEGVLDFAFREEEAWVVVELKSSLPDEAAQRAAREQLGWYVRAVASATGCETEGAVLLV